MDEFHIRIDKQYLHNQAGMGAREKERELAAGKSRAKQLIERVFDARTDERSWRRGAEGEEVVARRLERLPRPWAVVHDLTVGRRGANLDHLVLGPAGIFVLNTKNLTGCLTVYDHAVLQNGHKTAFVPAALREARTVQDRLSTALGRPVHAWSVLVVLGCEITIKKPLANLTLLREHDLPGWFERLPTGVFSEGDVLRLERLARDPDTWDPRQRSQRPAAPAPSASVPAAGTPTSPGGAISVRRWTRFGNDRLYANGPNGERLGYLDLPTGELHLEVDDTNGEIGRRLREAHAAA
ncbi:NERD domain-containing protein [Egicoccus sp. AB-alg6-2]|uniref:nuclease-related domain-containing protein n=1 Tax=Egicoccus sp. AB-alg6-2 TaxID=3242692 RepID=UPI00359D12C8